MIIQLAVARVNNWSLWWVSYCS